MVEIRIYEWPEDGGAMKQVGITYRALSVTWKEALFTPGSFEVQLHPSTRYAQAFQKYRMVRIGGVFWGLIDSVRYEADGSGQVMTVWGRDLKGLCADRLTVPPELEGVQGTAGYDAVIGPTETVIKHFVRNNFFSTLDPARGIPGLVLAPDLGRGLPYDRFMARFQPLSEVLAQLGEAAGLGYAITPTGDGRQFVFDVVQGVSRTAGQRELPPVVFSLDRGTATSLTYENTDQSMKNLFYTTRSGAEFADETLTMTYTREDGVIPAGIRRREAHLSLSADTPNAGEEYAELKRLALIDAENYITAESFSAEALNARLCYGADYSLGDWVTIQSKDWGVTMDAMVTAAETSYSASGKQCSVTFGKQQATIFDRLKREIHHLR